MKNSRRSSHMGVRAEKVRKVQLLWPSLCFCRHLSKVVQNVPEKVSDGWLGAWILTSSFLKVVSFPYTQLVTWGTFRNVPPSLVWLHLWALCCRAPYPDSQVPAFTCPVKFYSETKPTSGYPLFLALGLQGTFCEIESTSLACASLGKWTSSRTREAENFADALCSWIIYSWNI